MAGQQYGSYGLDSARMSVPSRLQQFYLSIPKRLTYILFLIKLGQNELLQLLQESHLNLLSYKSQVYSHKDIHHRFNSKCHIKITLQEGFKLSLSITIVAIIMKTILNYVENIQNVSIQDASKLAHFNILCPNLRSLCHYSYTME